MYKQIMILFEDVITNNGKLFPTITYWFVKVWLQLKVHQLLVFVHIQ